MGDSGPENAIKDVVEDVVGKAKEVAGIVSGNDGLKEVGALSRRTARHWTPARAIRE